MSDTPGSSSSDWNQMAGKVKAAKGPDRYILIAAAVLLVDSFLPWIGVLGFNANAWDVGGTVLIGIIACVLAGLLSLLPLLGKKMDVPPITQLVLGSIGFILITVKFLGNTEFMKFGWIIGIAASGAVAWFALQKKKT